MKVGRCIPKLRKQLYSFGVSDCLNHWVTFCRCNTSLYLNGILEVSTIREPDGQIHSFGFLIEEIVIAIRIYPP